MNKSIKILAILQQTCGIWQLNVDMEQCYGPGWLVALCWVCALMTMMTILRTDSVSLWKQLIEAVPVHRCKGPNPNPRTFVMAGRPHSCLFLEIPVCINFIHYKIWHRRFLNQNHIAWLRGQHIANDINISISIPQILVHSMLSRNWGF